MRRGASRRQILFDQRRDYVPILGVDHRLAARVTDRFQRPQQLAVIQAKTVGHVELETAATGVVRGLHLVEFGDFVGTDGHVQAVIDHHLGVGLGPAIRQSRQHGLLRPRLHEIDDGGGSAQGRGARAGEEIVGRDHIAAQRHLHVHVDVDAAGDDVFARGVDFLSAVQRFGDGGDASILNADVGVVGGGRGDDEAVFDYKFESHVISSHRVMSWSSSCHFDDQREACPEWNAGTNPMAGECEYTGDGACLGLVSCSS